MKKLFFAFSFLSISSLSIAQSIKILHEGLPSFRGMSVVDNDILWVSGSQGTIGRSLDGGTTWKWIKVSGFEKSDFRDIEAFDKNTAVIMSVSEPAFILRTSDAGDNWQIVYEDSTPGIFLDAMEFQNDKTGIVLGDPINHKFFIGKTSDGGKTWKALPENERPLADSGEVCFAASGTNIRSLTDSKAVFVTGGFSSHIFIGDQKISLPIIRGKETTGANSIAIKNKKIMIVVGGDFNEKDDPVKNCVITKDGGITWDFPKINPGGYRSCIEYLSEQTWITCGLNGVDISRDEGDRWQSISKESFHVVQKAKNGQAVYFAGNNGKIGKLMEDD